MLDLQSIVNVPASVMARRVGDEVIVLDLAGGEYFGLPDVGARMWECLLDGQSLQEVANIIASEYEVDQATADADVARIVAELRDRGLVAVSPSTALEGD